MVIRNSRSEKNQNTVLNKLKNKPLGFCDWVKSTGFSETGLNNIRKRLLEKKFIVQVIIDGKKGYAITKQGQTSLDNYPYLGYLTEQIFSRDGLYHSDYSTTMGTVLSMGLPWGIQSDLTYDKEIMGSDLISSKDVIEIENILYKKISDNLKKKKIKKEQIGNMILGFNINCENLLKSVSEQSLDYVDNVSKEESKLLSKYSVDPESLTEKELKRLNVLNKKTREKIKKLNL